LTCGSSGGSAEELVALMLMHRAAIGLLRAVAAHVRWARVFQGRAAGVGMAVPVNWRAFENLVLTGKSSGGALGAMMQSCSSASPMRLKHGKHAGELPQAPPPVLSTALSSLMTQSDLASN
jgi:hypothetical protein